MQIYLVIATICGWHFISKLQGNFVIFTTLGDYLITKFMASFILGSFITPFYLIYLTVKIVIKIVKFFLNKKQQQING